MLNPGESKKVKTKKHNVAIPQPKKLLFEQEYIATKGDIRESRTELKGDIRDLRTELKGDIALIHKDIEMLINLGKLYGIIMTFGFICLGLLIKL